LFVFCEQTCSCGFIYAFHRKVRKGRKDSREWNGLKSGIREYFSRPWQEMWVERMGGLQHLHAKIIQAVRRRAAGTFAHGGHGNVYGGSAGKSCSNRRAGHFLERSADLCRLIAMEVLREWLEKTAAAIVAVLSEEHLY
jgi:hypothetical protein